MRSSRPFHPCLVGLPTVLRDVLPVSGECPVSAPRGADKTHQSDYSRARSLSLHTASGFVRPQKSGRFSCRQEAALSVQARLAGRLTCQREPPNKPKTTLSGRASCRRDAAPQALLVWNTQRPKGLMVNELIT